MRAPKTWRGMTFTPTASRSLFSCVARGGRKDDQYQNRHGLRVESRVLGARGARQSQHRRTKIFYFTSR
jgi:hypothetical protein